MTIKQELTRRFAGQEFTTSDIQNIVIGYPSFFKDVLAIDKDDFDLYIIRYDQVSNLERNIKKVNNYYELGLIKKFLTTPKLNPYSKDVYYPTGHNNLDVEPMSRLPLKFVCA